MHGVFKNGAKPEYVQKVKHLGMSFTPDMDNSKELIEKKGNFIGPANHILTKYGKIYSPVKCKMIETYCAIFIDQKHGIVLMVILIVF